MERFGRSVVLVGARHAPFPFKDLSFLSRMGFSRDSLRARRRELMTKLNSLIRKVFFIIFFAGETATVRGDGNDLPRRRQGKEEEV
jgi:hypothetical protein